MGKVYRKVWHVENLDIGFATIRLPLSWYLVRRPINIENHKQSKLVAIREAFTSPYDGYNLDIDFIPTINNITPRSEMNSSYKTMQFISNLREIKDFDKNIFYKKTVLHAENTLSKIFQEKGFQLSNLANISSSVREQHFKFWTENLIAFSFDLTKDKIKHLVSVYYAYSVRRAKESLYLINEVSYSAFNDKNKNVKDYIGVLKSFKLVAYEN